MISFVKLGVAMFDGFKLTGVNFGLLFRRSNSSKQLIQLCLLYRAARDYFYPQQRVILNVNNSFANAGYNAQRTTRVAMHPYIHI